MFLYKTESEADGQPSLLALSTCECQQPPRLSLSSQVQMEFNEDAFVVESAPEADIPIQTSNVMFEPHFLYRKSGPIPGAGAIVWPVALLASLSIVVVAAMTPWLAEGPRAVIQTAYQTLCHQRADRSFGVGGAQFAVCHRCFGIYSGIAVGLLALPIVWKCRNALKRYSLIVLCTAVAPLVFDWGVDALGLWSNTAVSRLVTGLLAGVAGGSYLSLAISEGNRPRAEPGPQTE